MRKWKGPQEWSYLDDIHPLEPPCKLLLKWCRGNRYPRTGNVGAGTLKSPDSETRKHPLRESCLHLEGGGLLEVDAHLSLSQMSSPVPFTC